MQHLLTYIPPRPGAAAADSVLSISLLNRENKPPKKSQYNLLHHSNFIIIIFFARNKDCEKNKKKKQRNQSQNKQTFLIRFRKIKYRQIYHEISARLEIYTSTIATKILHKFLPCSCVCGSLNKRSGRGGSSGNTVCSTPYVRNIIRIYYIFVRIFVCLRVDMVCGLPIGLGDFVRIVLESINRKMINSLHGKIF